MFSVQFLRAICLQTYIFSTLLKLFQIVESITIHTKVTIQPSFWTCLSIFSLAPGASWTQTFFLGMMRQSFYHYTTLLAWVFQTLSSQLKICSTLSTNQQKSFYQNEIRQLVFKPQCSLCCVLESNVTPEIYIFNFNKAFSKC